MCRYGRRHTLDLAGSRLGTGHYTRLVLPDTANITAELHDPRHANPDSEHAAVPVTRLQLRRGARTSASLAVSRRVAAGRCEGGADYSYRRCGQVGAGRGVVVTLWCPGLGEQAGGLQAGAAAGPLHQR